MNLTDCEWCIHYGKDHLGPNPRPKGCEYWNGKRCDDYSAAPLCLCGGPVRGARCRGVSEDPRPLTKYDFGGEQLKLKAHGELWHTGWDIPTRWAISEDGRAWADDAHGDSLEVVEPEYLVSQGHDSGEATQNHLRKLLGLPVPEPAWMERARAAGWRPEKRADVELSQLTVQFGPSEKPGFQQVHLSTEAWLELCKIAGCAVPKDETEAPCGTRCEVPGRAEIGRRCSGNRRSLWYRSAEDGLELCAGREGNDAHCFVPRDSSVYADLKDVLSTRGESR